MKYSSPMAKKMKLAEIEAQTEAQLFRQIWILSKKRSYLSGLFLRDFENTPQFPSCFAHTIGKKRFPFFRLYGGNIKLLTPHEHHLWDNGRKCDREEYRNAVKTADWQKLEKAKEELTALYQKHFPYSKNGMIYKYDTAEVHAVIRKLNKEFFEALVKN